MGRPRRSVGAGSPPRGRGKEIHFRETVSCHGITPAWAGKSKYTLGTVESAWDHPRVGGEKVTTGMTLIGNGGSPPRGRGKARLRVVQVPTKRITPAWAGKSCAPLTGHITGRDHPRVGGEKHRQGTAPRAGPGSPPRGRGKGIKPCYHRVAMGITPAWAGKSCQSAAESAPGWDHPRVGGEKRLECFKETARQGSPPRGRGKGGISGDCFFLPRITPAWAGKRLIKHLVQQLHGDHPRVGGEKEIHKKFTSFRLGSPPRGRGKGKGPQWALPLLGITPAWAGKSISQTSMTKAARDHPRVGGEKGLERFWSRSDRGSPPRGRGKVPYPQRGPEVTRITPAWAGKRSVSIFSAICDKDHPRVGGEKQQHLSAHHDTPGSPPRGRGKD